MSKPMEFWVVIGSKYPSVLDVNWGSYRNGEVLEWAQEKYPKIERDSLQAIRVREVRRAVSEIKLPEQVERQMTYISALLDAAKVYDRDLCIAATRRAAAVALLRGRHDEHDRCCDQCIRSDRTTDDCKRAQALQTKADAIERDGT